MKIPFAVSLVFLAASAVSQSAVISTADGLGADAMVIGGTNSSNTYGLNPSLLIKNVSPVNQFTRKIYLRFDLSSITEPFTAAALNLTVADNNNGTAGVASSFSVAVFGLNDSASGQSWGESSITWNNAPGNINSGSSFDAQATVFLGNLQITTSDIGGTEVTFSSSALLDFLSADTDNLVTIMLARTDTRVGENLAFYGKEADGGLDAPSLALQTVPEASALCVTLLGCAAFGRRRRRD